MKAEVVSIGRELLMGDTVDTNASFLGRQLPLLGIELVWVSQVGDNQPQIVEVLRRAWHRSDLVLTTGGLGPTADDLTREAVADLMGEPMTLLPDLELALRDRFRRFGMAQMPESNLKQCTCIPSGTPLSNPQGTAPGWWVEKDGRILVSMPGPPREMQDMWEREVRPRLQSRSKYVIRARTWKTLGLSEGAVGELVFPLFPGDNPSMGVYAKPDGIEVQLKVTAETEAEADSLMDRGETRVREALGRYIWATGDETLEIAVGRLLVERALTVAAMEDHSGGLLTSTLSAAEDSSRFLKGGIVALTDESKVALGVSREAISKHGSVSAEVAVAMAEAARERFAAHIGIGVSGIEPVGGTVHIALVDGRTRHTAVRSRGRQRLVPTVLFELRKLLLGDS